MAVTKYSDADKAAICADWALLGDDKAVADKHGVKLGTLKTWKREAWFKDLLVAMQETASQRLIAKSHRAMNTALDELEDRLYRGDVKCLIKDGDVVSYREPVRARDLGAIINVLATRSERAAALTNQQTASYQLADLQTSFRQFAKSYRAKQIGDSTVVDGLLVLEESEADTTTDNAIDIDNGTIGHNNA